MLLRENGRLRRSCGRGAVRWHVTWIQRLWHVTVLREGGPTLYIILLQYYLSSLGLVAVVCYLFRDCADLVRDGPVASSHRLVQACNLRTIAWQLAPQYRTRVDT